MKKSLKIIGVVAIIVLVFFVGAWIWAMGLKEDKANTKVKMDEIKDAYPNFNKAVDEYSNLRNQFYTYKEDLYLETLKDNTKAWNDFMNKYVEGIKKVESSAEVLKKNCDLEYGDIRINTKCNTFKANYEAANNYYINDVKLYNQLVDEYEKYNKGNNYPKVNKVELNIYKDYIDYDKDGECFGKGDADLNE